MDRQVASTVASFDRILGGAPRFAASAPGRVNLIGEHTDYNEGFVLPLAIDRRAVIVAARARGGVSRIHAVDLGEHLEVDLAPPLEPLPSWSWANNLLGVVHGFAERGIEVPNLDLVLTSGIPMEAGLSSSAAVEVAMATLLEAVTGATLDPLEKALLCQAAEHTFVGTPCGIMDVLAAVSARPGCAMLIDCRANRVEHVPMPASDEAVLLIVQTGVRRRLADGAYEERRSTCGRAASGLGVRALRDASPATLEASDLAEPERRRAAHVIGENARTLRAAASLRGGDLGALGQAMFESHASLRDLYEVSCPELETIVSTARSMHDRGVFGARMTGAGFGGCAIVLCRPETRDAVAARIADDFTRAHGRSPAIFETRASGPAGPVAC